MTISDIITLLSLVIAIVAIINEKHRKHLLLKYSWFDLVIYVFSFTLINYFVFYDEFYKNGFYLEFLYFENVGLKNPKHFAYIISIITLISILMKISFGFYPYRNKWRVVKYYSSLIENNEIQFLLNLIEKDHVRDIIKRINTYKEKELKESDYFEEESRGIFEKVYTFFLSLYLHLFSKSRSNRFLYSRLVLNKIINDPAFIAIAANTRPFFFADIISVFTIEKRNCFPTGLINNYLVQLIRTKNFWLIKELKQSDNFDSGQPEHFFDENRITASLIQNISVSDASEIWKSFGEEGIIDIEYEFDLGNKSKLHQIFRNEDVLYGYSCFISIKFINILIIESIVQNYEDSHFWMYYYNRFTEKILSSLDETPPVDIEVRKSNYHYLLMEMNSNMLHWLNLSNEKENKGKFHDVINCVGEQMHYVLQNDHFGEDRKKEFISNLLSLYCSLSDKEHTNKIRSKLEDIFIKPCMLTSDQHPYYGYIDEVWKSFDKLLHRGYGSKNDYDYFKQLKTKVIEPLGLDPNAR